MFHLNTNDNLDIREFNYAHQTAFILIGHSSINLRTKSGNELEPERDRRRS